MCTVTWFTSSEGFELFCNRDERRTRAAEEPPREYEAAGMRFLAPRDGEGGGTWIAVNELGFAACILNLYQAEGPLDAVDARSRGRLVRDLADCSGVDELALRTRAELLAPYRPFTLLGMEPGRPARRIDWNGRARRENDEVHPPLVSSSVDVEGATATRRTLHARLSAELDDPRAAHLAFHASHADGPGPRSVCMHRDDAETRSLTHVIVAPGEVRLRHAMGSPCSTPLGDALRLERRAPQSAGNV